MKRRFTKKVVSLLLVFLVVAAFPLQPAYAGGLGNSNLELTLVKGTTGVNVTNFAADVKKAVYELYGIPGDRLNINIAGTTVVDQKNNFNWTIYDHYYAPDYPANGNVPVNWSVYHSVYQPYFYYSEVYRGNNTYYTDASLTDGSMKACFYRSKHIYAKDSDLIFLGYSSPGYKDFMLFPDQNVGEKTIEFAIDQSGVSTHTLEGAGFLFNSSIVDNKINGYLIYYNYQNAKIELYKLTNVDATAFHQEANKTISSLAITGIQRVAVKAMKSNAKTKNIKVQVTANSLKFFEDGVAIYDTTGADSEIAIQDTGAGGFGPLVGYSPHGCSQLSYFIFKNLAMVSTRSVSFMDVINKQVWSQGSNRIIVNLDDDSVPEFSNSAALSQIASLLKANLVHYLGWGHNLQVASAVYNAVYNKDQADQLIAQNNQKGMFINIDDPNSDTYEKGIAAIARYINTLLQDNSAPAIGQVTPVDGAQVYSVNSVSVSLSDLDSGINAEGSNITVTGSAYRVVPGSVGWAGGVLRFIPANPLTPDAYTVMVTVADNAGNRTQSVIHFTVLSQYTGGSSGDSSPPVPLKPPAPVKPKVSFTDIVNHWSRVDVEKLATDKFVYGYPDGTFRPDNSVTRAEFATVLLKVFDAAKLKQTTNAAVYFSDVASGAWYYDAVSRLAPEGIIKGYGDGTFGPDKLITREEAAAMIAQMVAKLNIQVPDSQLNFKDNDQISLWAKTSVEHILSLDIIKGMPDGTFQPANNSTRAEAAVMVLRLMQKAKLI